MVLGGVGLVFLLSGFFDDTPEKEPAGPGEKGPVIEKTEESEETQPADKTSAAGSIEPGKEKQPVASGDAPSPPSGEEALDKTEGRQQTAPQKDSDGKKPPEGTEAPAPEAPAVRGAFSGKVIDHETEAPFAGMTVEATLLQSMESAPHPADAPDVIRVKTASDGSYLFEGLPCGTYKVAPKPEAGGEGAFLAIPEKKVIVKKGEEAHEVVLRLVSGGSIAVEATHASGEPVVDAACLLEGAERASKRTDKEGGCRFSPLPLEGIYTVNVEAAGFLKHEGKSVELTREKPVASVLFVMTASCSISGSITYANGLIPVQKVTVFLARANGDADEPQVKLKTTGTDAKGGFQFEGLSPGRYVLGVESVALTVDAIESSNVICVLKEGMQLDDVSLILRKKKGIRVALSGKVTDDAGSPVEGVRVQIMEKTPFGSYGGFTSVRTDATGRFTYEKGKSECHYRVVATHAGYLEAVIDDFEEGGKTHQMETLVLHRYSVVSGRVELPEGRRRAEGRVQGVLLENAAVDAPVCKAHNLQHFEEMAARIAPDGSFTVSVPPGTIQLKVQVSGCAPAFSKPLSVAPGKQLTGIQIPVFAGAVIAAKILSTDGTPLQGATLKAKQMPGKEIFRFLRFDASSGAQARVFSATSTFDGVCEVARLPEGRYEVTAEHFRCVSSEPQLVSVQRDERRELTPFFLSRGGNVLGTVRRGKRPGAACVVVLERNGKKRTAVTDQSGEFRFKGLSPGVYTLQVLGSMLQRKTRQVTVKGGATVTCNIALD